MRRREFFALVATAAQSALPAFAQAATVRRVAVISGQSEAEMGPLIAALRQQLGKLGWIEGKNLAIVLRVTGGNTANFANVAAEAIASQPDVVVSQGTPSLVAVRKLHTTVPVVFMFVADPVGQGLVDSLPRPGGFSTGFTNFEFAIASKWLELLMEASPDIRRVLWLTNPANPGGPLFFREMEKARANWQVAIEPAAVRNRDEITAAIERFAATQAGGMIVQPEALMTVNRATIIGLAARHRLPAIYAFSNYPASGGLMSYGLNQVEMYRESADYVDRILRGTKPADLPVQAPRKFDLVINLKTAKALGIELSAKLLAIADEVIE